MFKNIVDLEKSLQITDSSILLLTVLVMGGSHNTVD